MKGGLLTWEYKLAKRYRTHWLTCRRDTATSTRGDGNRDNCVPLLMHGPDRRQRKTTLHRVVFGAVGTPAKPYFYCTPSNRRVFQQCPTIAGVRGTRGHCCTSSRSLAYSKSIVERGCNRSLPWTHTRQCRNCTAPILTLLHLRSLWTGMFLSPPSMAASGPAARVAARLSPARKPSPRPKALKGILFLIDGIQSWQCYSSSADPRRHCRRRCGLANHSLTTIYSRWCGTAYAAIASLSSTLMLRS